MSVIQLSEFIEALSNIVGPNRFLVLVEPPTGLFETTLDADLIKFYVSSATLPDRTFGDIEMKFFGMTYRLPGNETLSDLTLTVINDNEWQLRDFFESWSNCVNDREDSTKAFAQELFTGSSITVNQLGFTGETLASYQFLNVFPKTVTEIELNQDTMDTHETFQVTFDYSYWKRLPVEGSE